MKEKLSYDNSTFPMPSERSCLRAPIWDRMMHIGGRSMNCPNPFAMWLTQGGVWASASLHHCTGLGKWPKGLPQDKPRQWKVLGIWPLWSVPALGSSCPRNSLEGGSCHEHYFAFTTLLSYHDQPWQMRLQHPYTLKEKMGFETVLLKAIATPNSYRLSTCLSFWFCLYSYPWFHWAYVD